MSERPDTDTTETTTRSHWAPWADFNPWGEWSPSDSIPWGKSLWGTTIDFGGGANLVIDKNGIGTFTHASGERGVWSPTATHWVEEGTGELKDSNFAVPGTSPWDLSVTARRLEELADQSDDPVAIAWARETAKKLRERAAGP